MARQEVRRPFLNLRRSNKVTDAREPNSGGVVLPPFWKAMIITSFVINLVLIFVVVLLLGFVVNWRSEIGTTTLGVQGFARTNIVELRDVVEQLQAAHIRTTIPLNQPLPLKGLGVVVPVDTETVVTTTEPVPLSVPAAIDMGAFGQLYPNVSLSLPAGTQLKIRLKMDIPLDAVTIPIKLDVPVDIAMENTELAPQFRRLGEVVDRLVGPVAPLLDIDMNKPDPPEAPAP
jgi:hypothetical protein